MKSLALTLVFCSLTLSILAQHGYWQQRADYQIEFELDVEKHQFTGKETISYSNNSPDTLHKIFMHLYFNAFKPGSMMDVRSRTIKDPDRRVGSRISKLSPDEIGSYEITSLKHDGKKASYEVNGTVLEISLAKPILPGAKAEIALDFKGQVPVQIRRSGRDNAEGIAYSMAQWFPKMAEYDKRGWNADPYVAREFYAPWGSFDVKISLDSSYTVAASGYLQNAKEIGHGYLKKGEKATRPKGSRLTWHFKAPGVHDFVWAADKAWKHSKHQVPDGPMLHMFYVPGERTKAWEKLPAYFSKGLQYMNKHFGRYPYKQYSVIQGGDGGMEYPMATLITGHRGLRSLVGVVMHELAHSWYQMVLATNEARYAWMDEGFTTYSSSRAYNHLFFPDSVFLNPITSSYLGYQRTVEAGLEEPLSTHADQFETNQAYSMAAYSKGSIFVQQLKYVVGEEAFNKGMLRYFREWKFKHPTDADFIRLMEKQSGLELDWYLNYWAYTTKTIDYSVDELTLEGKQLKLRLANEGTMPMPIDLLLEYADGSTEMHYIPIGLMRGGKPANAKWGKSMQHPDWLWTHPHYDLELELAKGKKLKSVTIDPTGSMADINPSNNRVEINPNASFQFKKD